jgi:hypothetical protein
MRIRTGHPEDRLLKRTDEAEATIRSHLQSMETAPEAMIFDSCKRIHAAAFVHMRVLGDCKLQFFPSSSHGGDRPHLSKAIGDPSS